MNLNHTILDPQWQAMLRHHNDTLVRLRGMMAEDQSETDTEPDDVQLIPQENFPVAPQNERMGNGNSSVNWFGGGIVTEAMQRLTPITVGEDPYPNPHEQALENIQLGPFGHLMQPLPLIPMFNMDNSQHLGYDEVESLSVEVVLPGLIMEDAINQARPATQTTSEDEDEVCMGRGIANQERSTFNRPRPRNNNSLVADPLLANIRHTEYGDGGNGQHGVQASDRVNTANPFAGFLANSPLTTHEDSSLFGSIRSLGLSHQQAGPSTFRRMERNATAFAEDSHLANNLHPGFENRGILNLRTQPNYFPGSVFNPVDQFAHLSPPPSQAANEDDDIIFLRQGRANQEASGTERPRRRNSGFVERRNMSNNRQSELRGEVNHDFPTFGMNSRDNPFANAQPHPIPPLTFAFPESTSSYTVPIISLDQVRDRLRQRDEAIAGRGPPQPPLVPDGEAELFYFGTPGFVGRNVGGHNRSGDNGGSNNGSGDNAEGHNGGYSDGGQRNWERFHQNAAGGFNPAPQFRFMAPGGSNGMPFEGMSFHGEEPRTYF